MFEMRLHDPAGNRLYLNAEELAVFLAGARKRPPRPRTLCETLHWTGCRPSELLKITPARVDLSVGTIAICSLKKRKDASGRQKVIFRSAPVPTEFLDTLNTAHGIREAQRSGKKAVAAIWDLSRVRIWEIVKTVMIEGVSRTRRAAVRKACATGLVCMLPFRECRCTCCRAGSVNNYLPPLFMRTPLARIWREP